MDTNVAVVANGKSVQADLHCVRACMAAITRIRSEWCLLLDLGGQIVAEYRQNLRPVGQPGVGDAFFKWLWDHQGHAEHCRTVAITPDPNRGFVEFPPDPDLASFDPSDRKFVAVALASQEAPAILNAVDTDWRDHHAALARAGVRVMFCCPQHVGPES